jgi:predicted nucleic acid-binding protein
MSFLLDTNVVSEWSKSVPNPRLITWLAEVDEDSSFLSVITLAEIRYGIERLPSGKRKRNLQEWLGEDLQLRFEGRILSVDAAIADQAGRMVAQSEKLGRAMDTADALLAATAKLYELTLVTRNTSDFKHLLPSILNPWN